MKNRTVTRSSMFSRPWLSVLGISRAGYRLPALPLAVLGASLLSGMQALPSKVGAAELPVPGAIVELFTSHGCSSCPPADKLLGELIREYPELVALEYHVDYWDTLVHGRAGAFKDPFSDPEYTLRQQSYNTRKLGGRTGVYTPQMIINGEYAAIGSQARFIDHALKNATARPKQLDVQLQEGVLRLGVEGEVARDTVLSLITFDIETTTEIDAGENKGLTQVNHHVVRSVEELRAISVGEGGSVWEVTPTLGAGQGCALLLQSRYPGTVEAAANCPRSLWKES